jgi:hypothetical protein
VTRRGRSPPFGDYPAACFVRWLGVVHDGDQCSTSGARREAWAGGRTPPLSFLPLTLVLVATGGCYLAHERPEALDAGRVDAAIPDAFVRRDAFARDASRADVVDARADATARDASAFGDARVPYCPLATDCPYDYVIMLDRHAEFDHDEACGTLDLEISGTDECGTDTQVRLAVMRCVGSTSSMIFTVTRAGEHNDLRIESRHGLETCGCTHDGFAEPDPPVGAVVGDDYLWEDAEDGVLEFAISAEDMTIHVEACAFF